LKNGIVNGVIGKIDNLLKKVDFCHFLPFLSFFAIFGVPGAIPENRPSIQPGFSVDLSGSNAGLKTEKNDKNR
jgi:hypothetical protein